MYNLLSQETEQLAKEIVDISIKVHKEIGPGLLESVYEKCFCHDLKKRNIPFERQVCVDIVYDNELIITEALRLDILVNKEIIIELKAQENFHPVWEAQLLSYLKLSKIRLGFLINFHVPLMKNGIKRIIL
jgi:GxxExxY protein